MGAVMSTRGDEVMSWPEHQEKQTLSVFETGMPSANVVQRLVVVHNRHVCMLEERMYAQDLRPGCPKLPNHRYPDTEKDLVTNKRTTYPRTAEKLCCRAPPPQSQLEGSTTQ